MWHRNCIVLVLLGVAFANGTPVWFYNTGFGNTDPTGVGCSSFTREYDPYTGYFTYRCDPEVMNTNNLFTPTIENMSHNSADIDEKDLSEDYNLSPLESLFMRTRGPYAKATYQSFTSERSGSRKKNNRPNKRQGTNNCLNCCPAGQIFQSELNICINHPSEPPLPPKRGLPKRPTIRDNRCPPGQIYLSELDICINHA